MGTPAITTRGFTEIESARVAKLIAETLKNIDNTDMKKKVKREIESLCEKILPMAIINQHKTPVSEMVQKRTRLSETASCFN